MTRRHKAVIEDVLAEDCAAAEAYRVAQKFCDLLDRPSMAAAHRSYQAWRDALSTDMRRHFRKVINLVREWNEEIFGYCDGGWTNGGTEARNKRVRRVYEASESRLGGDLFRERVLRHQGAHLPDTTVRKKKKRRKERPATRVPQPATRVGRHGQLSLDIE